MDWRTPAVALAVLVAGCGAPVDAPSDPVDTSEQVEATNDAEAWVAQDDTSVVLLRWTENEASQISGALQLAQLVDYKVEGQSWPIDGVVGDGEIVLTVDGFLETGSTVTGDYSGNELTLFWPQSNGSMSAVIFSRGTVTEYNNAVDALRQSGAEAAAWQEQAEYEANAISEADSGVASARTNLERAIGEFADDQAWAGYSIDSVQYALDSLEDAVIQLEDTLDSAPEFADSDLDWAESSYTYLRDQAEYALGPNGLGVIDDSIANLTGYARELEVAIENLRDVEDRYLNSELAPYDTSAEMALIDQARTIINSTGPAAISEHRSQVDERVSQGTDLIELARSLAD
jgi:hypothetical protein